MVSEGDGPAETAPAAKEEQPEILLLRIQRYRGISDLTWRPSQGLNLILGGSDAGKTTILDAIALLFSPSNATTVGDSDYYRRSVEAGFEIEAIVHLPPTTGVNSQFSPAWPWEWNGTDAVVPGGEGGPEESGRAVYRVRVVANENGELAYELIQPSGQPVGFSVALRRAIGLVRLTSDDRSDRDLRLVQGSALDRLLTGKTIRSKLAIDLAKENVAEQLGTDGSKALDELNKSFEGRNLPHHLALAITGGQGSSITSMVGLTADCNGVPLPVTAWGAGTRRLSGLAIAEHLQGNAPLTVVDEAERALEPYRQRELIEKLQAGRSQSFVTTHSPFVIAAASGAALWYLDPARGIGGLDAEGTERARSQDPELFLSRIPIVAEGKTEVGFVSALLERALGGPPSRFGVYVADGAGHESALGLLEALGKSGVRFAGFVDEENGKHSGRWSALANASGKLLFRWPAGSTERNVMQHVGDADLERLMIDPDDERTGFRRDTLAARLGVRGADYGEIVGKAGGNLRPLMIEAAEGFVRPEVQGTDRKVFAKHGQSWFKSKRGGRELERKMFALGVWAKHKESLLAFCNAVREQAGLAPVPDLRP